jgi:hypothetical protein
MHARRPLQGDPAYQHIYICTTMRTNPPWCVPARRYISHSDQTVYVYCRCLTRLVLAAWQCMCLCVPCMRKIYRNGMEQQLVRLAPSPGSTASETGHVESFLHARSQREGDIAVCTVQVDRCTVNPRIAPSAGVDGCVLMRHW